MSHQAGELHCLPFFCHGPLKWIVLHQTSGGMTKGVVKRENSSYTFVGQVLCMIQAVGGCEVFRPIVAILSLVPQTF